MKPRSTRPLCNKYITSFSPPQHSAPRDIGRIAHGEDRFQRRPIANHAVFENADGVGRVSFFGDGKAQQRQTHADKDFIAVARFRRAAAATIKFSRV